MRRHEDPHSGAIRAAPGGPRDVSPADCGRAIDRLVAGLDFDHADAAAAAAARAIDRATAMSSVMRGLRHPEGVVRIRAADRAARMDAVTPVMIAALRLIADADLDQRARAAAARALQVIAPEPGSIAAAALGRRRTHQPPPDAT